MNDPSGVRLPLPLPLVGRDEELAWAGRVLARGRSVVIAGRAGVGKTRLATALADRQEAAGAAVFRLVATEAIGDLPFGAVTALLPADVAARDRRGLVRATARTLRRRPGRVVVLVDDGHLLDTDSAALLLALNATGGARVVMTIRSHCPVPQPVSRLWQTDQAARLDLADLAAEEVTRLAEASVGGPLEHAAASWLYTVSQGNPLFVRELLHSALGGGALTRAASVWRLGDWRPGSRLTDLIGARLADVDRACRDALELLALAEPMRLDDLAHVCGPDAAADLERLELVAATDGRIRLAHPLYREVLRAAMGPAVVHQHLGSLCARVRDRGPASPAEVMRLVSWQLDTDQPVPPARVLAAAVEASRVFDHRLTSRLAAAAYAAEPSLPSAVLFAAAAPAVGRAGEAEDMLAAVEDHAAAAEDPFGYLRTRVKVLVWGLRRHTAATKLLERAEEWSDARGWASRLDALRLQVLHDEGRAGPAAGVGRRLLADPELPRDLAALAGANAATALTLSGRTTEGAEAADRAVAPYGGPVPAAVEDLPAYLAWCQVRLSSGHEWPELLAVARQVHAAATAEARGDVAAIMEFGFGKLALQQGQPVEAQRWLEETCHHLDAADHRGILVMTLSVLAQATGVAGDADAASQALRRRDSLLGRDIGPAFDLVDRLRGDVWAAAAHGELSRAQRLALGGADRCTDNRLGALFLLHDAVRTGLPAATVADRLAELGAVVDAPLALAMVEHVMGVAGRDLPRLDHAIELSSALGARLLAAEAAASAAELSHRAGRNALAASARARALAEACPGARTPLLGLVGDAAPVLTRREREVGELVARALSNADIAERLVISLRTVEAHVYRACTKLGVTSRRDLGELVRRARP